MITGPWIRSAFWVGQTKPGMAQAFREEIDTVMVGALAALPGVQNVKALWPERLEDSPPAISCQMLVQFASRADVDRMLASPERLALRPRVIALKAMFDGTISHIDYAVGFDSGGH